MTFTDLPANASVFLDANTLLYHFIADSQFGRSCTDLLERIEQRELLGFVSTHVISEVAHRLMTIEASLRFNRSFADIARWLKNHPGNVQQLTQFRKAIGEVLRYRLAVLTVPYDLLDDAAAVSQQTGLLHNDALIIAVMHRHGLTNIATKDADFDRVPGIVRYKPG